MSNINLNKNLVPLEFNYELYGGGIIEDYWWIGLILLVIIIVVAAVLMQNNNSEGTELSSSTSASSSAGSNVSIGVRTNDKGEKEYYKVVDGEEQPLTEEDKINLEAAQKTASVTQQQASLQATQSIKGLNIDQIIANSTSQATVIA
jgi:hypothetical protein